MENKNLLFHIESQDYFGTLAAVLSLVRQNGEGQEVNDQVLEKAEHDLVFLQSNYDIVPKSKTE